MTREWTPAPTNGSGWQKTAIAALWAVLLLFATWVYSDAQAARADMAKTIQASVERIATLEEAVRGLNRSLDRIEAGVNELRREPRK